MKAVTWCGPYSCVPIPLIVACLQEATGLALPLNLLTVLASLTHDEMPRAELSHS